MKRIDALTGLAALASAALIAGPAAALTVYATAHLNLRSGPGFQYPVVGQVQYRSPAEVTGCILDFSWCARQCRRRKRLGVRPISHREC